MILMPEGVEGWAGPQPEEVDGPTTRQRWTRSVYLPVALVLPWLLLLMGAGTKNASVLHAIRMVESSGQDSPPDGDDGLAIGPYQIHQIYWRDAVAFDPDLADGTYQDCRDREYAEAVVRAYMRQWVDDAWRAGNAEVIARTHNGGPTGVLKKDTDRYWNKVRVFLR